MMEPLDFTVYFLFTFHIILLVVKLWALYAFTRFLILVETPTTKKYMLVFKPFEVPLVLLGILMVIVESYFVFNFFEDVELYFYEYVSIFDQMFFTALVVIYLKREGRTDGKRQN